MRLRHRPDRFIWRENSLAFHRLADGPTLARLDPYASGEQSWPLHSGRVISVTAEEVRDISLQVLGLELPATRPADGNWDEARIHALEERIAALEAKDAAPRSRELEDVFLKPDPVGDDLERARKANRELLGNEDAPEVPPEIAALLDEGETLTRDVRRKLTERLNVELAELKNLRGLAGEDLKREAEIEKLLGLFARLGEI